MTDKVYVNPNDDVHSLRWQLTNALKRVEILEAALKAAGSGADRLKAALSLLATFEHRPGYPTFCVPCIAKLALHEAEQALSAGPSPAPQTEKQAEQKGPNT